MNDGRLSALAAIPSIKMITCLLERGADLNFQLPPMPEPDVQAPDTLVKPESSPFSRPSRLYGRPRQNSGLKALTTALSPPGTISIDENGDLDLPVQVIDRNMPGLRVWRKTLVHIYANYDKDSIFLPWDSLALLMIKHGAYPELTPFDRLRQP
jgi:hypothetical protein